MVTIPMSVRAIGEYAFTCCWNLRTAYVQSECQLRLSKCFGSETIILPSKRITVGDRSLWALRAVKQVMLPADLQQIGEAWFADTQIEQVIIPASVQVIRKWAFAECSKL